jgi:choline dehydrogenase-like flavoprotein
MGKVFYCETCASRLNDARPGVCVLEGGPHTITHEETQELWKRLQPPPPLPPPSDTPRAAAITPRLRRHVEKLCQRIRETEEMARETEEVLKEILKENGNRVSGFFST